MKTSPTQRSLKHLRAQGYACGIVEHWNPFAKIRQDLFKWIDIVAVTGLRETGIIGVQTTTRPNMGARLEKAKGNVALSLWLRSGGQLHIHGWERVKGHWAVRVRPLRLEDVE